MVTKNTKTNQDKPQPNRRPQPASSRGTETPTTASAWRQSKEEGTPLVVPSGNTCLVRSSSGLAAFVKKGAVPNSLMPVVQEAIKKGQAPSMDQIETDDPTQLIEDIMAMADNMVMTVVIKPKLHPVPMVEDDTGELTIEVPLEQREELEDALWVDEVDFEDKFFIFNWAVGGTADLEKFREEFGSVVGSVPGR